MALSAQATDDVKSMFDAIDTQYIDEFVLQTMMASLSKRYRDTLTNHNDKTMQFFLKNAPDFLQAIAQESEDEANENEELEEEDEEALYVTTIKGSSKGLSSRWCVRDLDDLGTDPESRMKAQLEFAQWFKRFMSTRTHHKDTDAEGKPKPARYHTLATFRTALGNYYHRNHSKGLPEPVLMDLKTFYRGKKKLDHKQVCLGEISGRVGKDSMSIELYEHLAWYFLRKGNIFAWTFHILSWQLM